MSQVIDLGRIRFYHRGAYSAATTYELNDVVLYGGSAYVYVYNTTSSGNLPTNTTYWSKMAEGVDYRGAWTTATSYFPNDVVVYGNITYICLTAHTSGTFATDVTTLWATLVEGFNTRGTWAANTLYYVNDIAFFGGNSYIANTTFTSDASAFENDTDWVLFAQGSAGGEVATQTANTGKLLSTDGTVTQWVSNIGIDRANANVVDANTTIYVGDGAEEFAANLLNPIAIFQINADDFAQLSFRNQGSNANSSTDIIAYTNDGDDNAGWIDMGITSNNFSDPEFTITGINDGYIFLEAPVNTAGNGDLVIATGGYGNRNAIVFAAGGLSSDNEQMTIVPDTNVHIEIATNSVSATTGALTVVGGIGTQGNINLLGDLTVQGSITVSGGAFQAETLTSTAPLLSTGSGATADDIERGFIAEYKRSTSTSSFLIGSVQSASNVLTIRRKSFDTISKSLTDNIASIVLTEAPDFVSGDTIVISNLGSPFDGTFTVNTVVSSTITYDVTASNVGTTADGDGVVAPNIDSSVFINGDRIVVANSSTASINGNRDFVIAVSGNTITTDFGSTVISNTATDGDVSVSTKTAYAGFVRADSSGSNKWHLVGNIAPVLSGNTYVPPSDNVDLTANTLTTPTVVVGGLEFVGSPTVSGNITFSGNSTFNTDNATFTNTVALGTSTVSGNPTLTGNPVFSGTPSFTGNPTFSGTPVFIGGVRVQEMIEDMVDVSIASANIAADYNDGNIFYVTTTPVSNFRLNISNAPTDNGRIFTVNLLVTQGGTGYIPNEIYINNVAQTLRWAAGVVPTPTSSSGKLDIFTFSVARRGDNYIVLGSANLNF